MFKETESLETIELKLRSSFKNIRLIGELDLSEEELMILGKTINNIIEKFSIDEIYSRYIASLLTFLVFIAVYKYNGAYWDHVKDYLSSGHIENIRTRLFSMLKKYGLPTFEELDSYRYVGALISHSILPMYYLDDFFNAIFDTLHDLDYMNEFAVDEFKLVMSYRIHIPAVRYLTNLGSQASRIFQEYRNLMIELENGQITLDKSIEQFGHSIPVRFIRYLWKWKENESTKEKICRQKNYHFTSPKLKLDVDGFGVYFLLPEQKTRIERDYKMEWQIKYENRIDVEIADAELYKKFGELYTEELLVRVLPDDTYTISLVYDGETINTWFFQTMVNQYMAFGQDGSFIKKDYLSEEEVIIILPEECHLLLSKEDHKLVATIPSWQKYKFVWVNLRNQPSICIQSSKSNHEKIIHIRKNTFPKLVGGEYLFGEQGQKSSQCSLYTILPKILIPDFGERSDINHWFIQLKKKDAQITVGLYQLKMDFLEENNNVLISLEQENLVTSKEFGEYEVRIFNSKFDSKSTFVVKYVPFVNCMFDDGDYLPRGKEGYQKTDLYFLHSQNVELVFDQAEYKGEVQYDGKMYKKYSTQIGEQYLYGVLSFKEKGQTYEFPIRKRIRPVSWGWIGLGDDKQKRIRWDTRWRKISTEDLERSTDVYLIVQAETFGMEYLIAEISLVDYRKKSIQVEEFKLLNEKNARIPLNRFLLTIRSLVPDSSYIFLKLFSPKREELTDLLLAKFQKELDCKNMQHWLQSNGVLFEWDETSSLLDREIIFYNLNRPWEDPIKETIPDGETSVWVTATHFADEEYDVKIQYRENVCFFTETAIYIPDKRTSLTIRVNYNPIEDHNNSFEDYMGSLLKALSQNRVSEEMSITYPEGLSRRIVKILSYAYLYIRKNKIMFEDKNLKCFFRVIRQIIQRLSKNESKYYILKELIALNFEKHYFTDLIHLFQLLHLPQSTGIDFTLTERQYLWRNMEYLGFLVDIRTKPKDRRSAVDRICNWLGDTTLYQLISGGNHRKWEESTCRYDFSDLRTCLQKSLWKECRCAFLGIALDEKVFGSQEQVTSYYYELYKSNKLDEGEIVNRVYEEFKKNGQDPGIPLFQKTYLKTFIDFNSTNANENHRSKLEQEIQKVNSPESQQRIKHCLSSADNQSLYQVLCLRRDVNESNELSYYSGILAFFQSSIARQTCVMDFPEYSVGHLVHQFYRRYHDLYLRDAVLFELYLIFRGDSK